MRALIALGFTHFVGRSTVKVKMLADAPGSPDGIRIEQYTQGETYDLGDDLAGTFLAEGLAEEPRAAPAAAAVKAPAKATKRAAPLENK